MQQGSPLPSASLCCSEARRLGQPPRRSCQVPCGTSESSGGYRKSNVRQAGDVVPSAPNSRPIQTQRSQKGLFHSPAWRPEGSKIRGWRSRTLQLCVILPFHRGGSEKRHNHPGSHWEDLIQDWGFTTMLIHSHLPVCPCLPPHTCTHTCTSKHTPFTCTHITHTFHTRTSVRLCSFFPQLFKKRVLRKTQDSWV